MVASPLFTWAALAYLPLPSTAVRSSSIVAPALMSWLLLTGCNLDC